MTRALTALAATMLLASLALSAAAVAQVNPYVLPQVTVTPSSGSLDTVVTVAGTGFSANVGVTCSWDIGLSSSATTGSSGGFSVNIALSGGFAGSNTVTCTGSDGGSDHASAVFTLTGETTQTATTVSTITASTQTVTVNNAGTTGVTATITGLPAGTSGVSISTAALTGPSAGHPAPTNAPSGTVYVDVHVTLPAGTTASGTANICVSNTNANSGWSLEYYYNGGWNAATNLTFPTGQVCGDIPVAALTGTNVAAIPGTSTNYTYLYLGAFVVVLVIIIAAGLLLRRRTGAK